MKKMLSIALALVALGLTGCPDPQCSSENGYHSYGKWTNVWEQPNPYGYMRQMRTCETCGYCDIWTSN